MSTDPNAIAERVANKLTGVRNFHVNVDQAVWERTQYEIEVPNDITAADEIEEYVREKIDADPDKYEITSSIIGEVSGCDTEYEIKPI